MLTSPEIQFGPFTWCLEATPQGVDEDRLVVSVKTEVILVDAMRVMIEPGDTGTSRWTWSTDESIASQVFTRGILSDLNTFRPAYY